MIAACQRWPSIQARTERTRKISRSLRFGLFLFAFLLLFFLDAISGNGPNLLGTRHYFALVQTLRQNNRYASAEELHDLHVAAAGGAGFAAEAQAVGEMEHLAVFAQHVTDDSLDAALLGVLHDVAQQQFAVALALPVGGYDQRELGLLEARIGSQAADAQKILPIEQQ